MHDRYFRSGSIHVTMQYGQYVSMLFLILMFHDKVLTENFIIFLHAEIVLDPAAFDRYSMELTTVANMAEKYLGDWELYTHCATNHCTGHNYLARYE